MCFAFSKEALCVGFVLLGKPRQDGNRKFERSGIGFKNVKIVIALYVFCVLMTNKMGGQPGPKKETKRG